MFAPFSTTSGRADVHIVVVDNASGDGSDDQIAAWIAEQSPAPPVSLIRSPTNSGYSGGHNQGMAARRAETYLILNSDALLRPGALETLLSAMRANSGAGFVAPRLEHEDGEPQRSCFRFPSPLGELLRAARTGALTALLRRFDLSLGVDPDPAEIEWASFACILVRGRMRDEIGPMDEGYFLYSEDTDYCWRARKAGWSIVFEPKARVVHLRGGSGPVKEMLRTRKRPPEYLYASRTRFLYRAYGRAGLLASNLLWHLGSAIGKAKRTLKGEAAGPVAGEPVDIWINFLDPLGDSRTPRGGAQ